MMGSSAHSTCSQQSPWISPETQGWMGAHSAALPSAQREPCPRSLKSCEKLTGQVADVKWVRSLVKSGSGPLVVMTIMPQGIPEKGQTMSRGALWQEFFSAPSLWSDNRFDKGSPTSADFRHKCTKEALWIESSSNPPWVKAKPVAMIQGQAQCGDIGTLCRGGQLQEALNILNQPGILADTDTYVLLLWECINVQGLAEGKQVHSHIIKSKFKPNIFLVNTLVNMYTKCGSVMDARRVFDELPERDMFAWNTMIAAYAKHGCGRDAFKLYEQMVREGVMPNKVTFICILKACASLGALEYGKGVHAYIVKAGIASYVNLENTLVHMYAKCGSLKDARQVFDSMAQRDVVSWNTMIKGYTQHGCGMEAFKMYEQMIRQGIVPDKVTFICVFNACARLGCLEKGKEVHSDIMKCAIAPDIIVETALADMYAKCGDMKNARQVFDNMAERNVISWSAMIAGYAQHGCSREAFEMFELMKQEGMVPNKVTFISILNACDSLEKGREIHADIIKARIVPDIILENNLIVMYANWGSSKEARQVFDQMAHRDVVSWSVMITGYAQHGCGREALETYEQMIREGVLPDKVTFICVLNVCANLAALEKGIEVQADIMKAEIAADVILENALIDMYAKCGSIKDARQVFDKMCQRDVVTWNAMIAGYAQHGYGRQALEIYEQMICAGETPDKVTFTCVLNACAGLSALGKGIRVQADIRKVGIAPDTILENALVDMYAKCGNINDARQVFDNMHERDVGSWTAMIAGYAQQGCSTEALQLFEEMQQEGLKPDRIIFICVLSACTHAGLLDEGWHYFDSMSREYSLTPTLEHFGCMVDLLGRAGLLEEAEDFIHKMPIKPDAAVWGALLGASRIHGNVEVAERAAKGFLKCDPSHTFDSCHG